MLATHARPARSYAAFHREVYPESIVDARDALGLTLLRSVQPAGRFVNAPTPDLVIGRSVGGRGFGFADLGAGRFRTTGRIGETMVMAPSARTAFDICAQHSILILGVPYGRLRGLDPELGLPGDGDFGGLHRGSFEDRMLAGLIDAIWEESATRTSVGLVFLEGALLTIAARLLRCAGRLENRLPAGLAPWQLRRALDRLSETPDESVSLAALAAEAGLSAFHFARAFKASTGLPPHRFQVRRRMERAQALLAETDLGMTAIALEVGYQSSQALARAFRRETGTTPSAFRNARQG